MSHRPRCRQIVLLQLLLFTLALPAIGEEIVVRNDSIENFSEAYIVGDFIQGEHAGVVLTSPCSGDIVAIQVLWLEGSAGNPQSLEEAIHIYAAGTFPTPGTELQLMEGPVMTPGFWNEFRYIDEAQTIPLEVPVIKGQDFYVTLEFYNPTNVGAGGPSVVRDKDGFTSGRNVLWGNIPPFGWRWWDFNGSPIFLAGDIAIRAVIDCPGATGACCHADGTCVNEVQEDDCAEFGDAWHEGLTCGEITCTPRGACCIQNTCLQLTEAATCTSIGGVYAGHGTDCGDDVCVAGACCLPDTGECVVNFEFQCVALGGDFQGTGTDCDPNPCPQPVGACCFGDVCVPGQTEAACTGALGQWAGPGTDCGPPNPCPIQQVCAGDLNCDGFIDFGDINPFVLALSNWAAWQAAYPDCPVQNADINADGQYGGPNGFGDINPFVSLLASGGGNPIPCD